MNIRGSIAFLVGLCGIFFASTVMGQTPALTLEEAKNWYEQQYAPLYTTIDAWEPNESFNCYADQWRNHPLEGDSMVLENSIDLWRSSRAGAISNGFTGASVQSIDVSLLNDRTAQLYVRWKNRYTNDTNTEYFQETCHIYLVTKGGTGLKVTNHIEQVCKEQ